MSSFQVTTHQSPEVGKTKAALVLIGLGASVPHNGLAPRAIILSAIRVIGTIFQIEQQSSLYHSPAWPDPNDPPFVNAVISVYANRDAGEILQILHCVEAAFGRRRSYRNAPRTLDLDLLAVGDEIRPSQAGDRSDVPLILPHPAIGERDFVLAPLAQILPKWTHPVSRLTAVAMLEALPVISAIRE